MKIKIGIKKIFLSVLAVIMIGTIMPVTSFAASAASRVEPIKADSILLDTNNPEVGIEIYVSKPIIPFAYSSTSASHSGRFYLKSDNSTLANIKATGKFTYDGTICNVTECKTSVSNVVDGWRVDVERTEEQVSPTLAKAVGEFYLYDEGIFGDNLSSSATITISCNQNGKTNTEFNGDE